MGANDRGGKEPHPLSNLASINPGQQTPLDQDLSGSIHVAICDACPTIRQGLEHILDKVPDIDIVAQVSSREELLSQANDLDIDVVLIDIEDHANDVSGYVGSFREKMPSSKILIFTNCQDHALVISTLEHGIEGFQCKRDAEVDDVVNAIHTVHKGGRDLAPCVTEALLMQMKSEQQKAEAQLSAREQQVLDLIAKGKTNDSIAGSLYISTRTVKFHVSSILSKLKVKNRTEAALWML